MFAVILIPSFPLQAALRSEPGAFGSPAALLDVDPHVERSRDKIRITQTSNPAREQAVDLGMTATQGQARCPDLRIVNRSDSAEQSTQEILIQWASSVSPRIEATGDGICTIDLTGSRHDQDPGPMGAHCCDAFARMNLVARVGIAANPELALLAAKFAGPVRIVEPTPTDVRKFLAPLPIESLSTSHEIVSVLRMWGLRTLGELAALPKEGVVERLGTEILPLWRQISGGEPRPLKLHRSTETLTEAMDFDHHVERLDGLLFVLNRFLHSLEVRLAELYLVAETLTLELRFENGDRHERVFRIPEPSRDVELLLRTLHTHLESFRAEAAIVSVRLTASPSRPAQQQLDLFQPSLRDLNRFSETLSRLEALLGSNRVGSPEVQPSHRPDAFKMLPFNSDPDPASPTTEDPPVRFGLSLRRFRPPISAWIELKKNLTEESLLRISAGTIRGKIRSTNGPWLASGDWWDQHQWQRREWDIELENGGLYRVAQEGDQWQIDGEYD